MPFRGILKVGSSTECSNCMDNSSKPIVSDVDLSQALYKGLYLMLIFAVLLLKFMRGKYGTVVDLERAFLHIVMAALGKDIPRYFWFCDPYDFFSDLLILTFKVMIFGSKASPFHLAASCMP